MNLHAPTLTPGQPVLRRPQDEPRFKIPASILIGETSIAATDWSRAGFGFCLSGADINVGDRFKAELRFDLPGGVLAVPVVAEAEHYDRVTGRGQLAYRTISGEPSPEIEFVIADYLAGRIAVMDGMLTKSPSLRSDASASRVPRAPGLGDRLRPLVGLALITLGGAAALYYLGSSIYDRLFVFEAVSAQVAFPSIEVDAPAGGTLTSVAAPGQVASRSELFKIVDSTGKETAVVSPCDCDVVAVGERQSGSYVSAGSAVMKLVRLDGTASVQVGVAFPDMRRVYDGASVDLKFLDGQVIHGAHIANVRSLGGEQSGLVTLEVDPGRALAASQYGEPVYARFDTAPWRRGR